jgi:hypothetical protein
MPKTGLQCTVLCCPFLIAFDVVVFTPTVGRIETLIFVTPGIGEIVYHTYIFLDLIKSF